MTVKTDLYDKNITELTVALADFDLPNYRIKQLHAAIHKNLITDFDDITNLPLALREKLKESCSISPAKIVKSVSAKDGTTKYLLELSDNNFIETVYIPKDNRGTLCISTMVGCPYGCIFCASGKSGFTRNLTVSEILAQFYSIAKIHKITNIVFMGIGEPLANYDNLIKAIRIIASPDGQNMSPRHITVSTVGIIEGIRKLANEKLPLNLAVSLHSPFQDEREKLIPSAKSFTISEIIAACHYYINRTGRKVSFEYTVIPGTNDKIADANELYRLTKNSQIMVNLIPLNNEGKNIRENLTAAKEFANLLREKGMEVAVRNSRGNDIFAACGQLQTFSEKV